jgi:hypothetical protein
MATDTTTRKTRFASSEADAHAKAHAAAQALGGVWTVECFSIKGGGVQWLAVENKVSTSSKYELNEASPSFNSSERDARKGVERPVESDGVTAVSLIKPSRVAQAAVTVERAAKQRVARDFFTTDRAEALSMAKSLRGAVRNSPGGYTVTRAETR